MESGKSQQGPGAQGSEKARKSCGLFLLSVFLEVLLGGEKVDNKALQVKNSDLKSSQGYPLPPAWGQVELSDDSSRVWIIRPRKKAATTL